MKMLLLASAIFAMTFSSNSQPSLSGAWSNPIGDTDMFYVIQDDYLVFVSYVKGKKQFYTTWGGPIKISGDKFSHRIEFNSSKPDEVGKEHLYTFRFQDNWLYLKSDGVESRLTRVDDGNGELAGNWRISARMQGDKMSPITLGPRKTLKILTGTRFQWIAINTETKEFFGTGGGTYTFKDGKYTENIEFFSRDGSRVGASLTFDGKVVNGVWVHSGLNSKGEPLHEEWSREQGADSS